MFVQVFGVIINYEFGFICNSSYQRWLSGIYDNIIELVIVNRNSIDFRLS